jgi:hypothetical protein
MTKDELRQELQGWKHWEDDEPMPPRFVRIYEKANVPVRIKKQLFILKYLNLEIAADTYTADFHTLWYYYFGGKRVYRYHGCSECPNANHWLTKLYNQGFLERGIITFREGRDYGKWCYTYSLSSLAPK